MSENIDVENMSTGDVQITEDDKLWALLGYVIPLVALIALLLEEKKDRPFVKYHAVHSLILAIISLVANVTLCGGLLVWLYAIYVGIQAYGGDWVVVPVVTDFAKDQGWV